MEDTFKYETLDMHILRTSLLFFYIFKLVTCTWFNLFENSYRKVEEESSGTGRIFVTMLGFPSRCQVKGSSYPCTLSLACWWIGGISLGGCGRHPWIVSCCVTSISKYGKNVYSSTATLKEEKHQHQRSQYIQEKRPHLQKRNDETEEECGLSGNMFISKRIIGGKEAQFAEYPWQAYIKISTFQCGGVLVSRRFVATAAHCVLKAKLKDIKIFLGELDTLDTGKVLEYEPAELHRVKRKIIHPKFQFRLIQPDRFDIALLEMLTEATLSYHILPICLPRSDLNLLGKKGVVTGWGKIKPSTELKGTNVLRSATVPILDTNECNIWHQMKDISVELHEDVLCAGHEDGHQDACLGDSGGPLIVFERGRWVLAGVTSAGFGCGEPRQPGIYHSVPSSVDWIRSVIYF